MAHEITQTDKVGIVGDRGWHGLGTIIAPGRTCVDAGREFLPWDPAKLPIYVDVPGAPDPDLPAGQPTPPRRVLLPDHEAVYRPDTAEILGLVSRDHSEITNTDMCIFGDAIVGADATVTVETIGSLRGGRRVFLSLKLPRTIKVIREDILDMFIVVSNAHDGSASFRVNPAGYRPVCANTLDGGVARWGHRGCTFRHVGNVMDKLEEARRALGIVLKQTDRLEENIARLAANQVTSETFGAFLSETYDRTFGAPKAIPEEDPTEREVKVAEYTVKRKVKVTDRWTELLERPNRT
jgi:phage/plasmid-like protein (TIGR03299 family)